VSDALDRSIPRERNPMLDPANKLKLAVFCANTARGTSLSYAESLPKASWPESERLALAADAAGIDGFIPLGRWKQAFPGRPEDDRVLETFTFAAAVAAITTRISVFATVHMPIFHPELTAAMSSTIDNISRGRFSINVVAGFNANELQMFGVEQLPHDERYEFADEWTELLKRIWTAEERFDFHGRYFDALDLIYKPLPIQKPYPVIMSAGSSPAGRRFAAKHADMNFVHLPSLEELPAIVAEAKQLGRETVGREAGIFAGGYMVCADTEEEAWRRYHYVVRDKLDREWTAQFVELFTREAGSTDVIPVQERVERMAAGFNALPLVGTAEQIVERMQAMSAGGLDGIALSFDDYDDGIAAYDEAVRPLLAEAGLRSI
jgi:alkanesulfonate monooxygenase SsuD/methylene tetrahydromethanopterin reductase-like flavin-dependent oxidoreductase (luciferase family)